MASTTIQSELTNDERSRARDDAIEGEDFAVVLARFACGLSLSDLADPVIAAAKVNVFDTLACAAAGSSAPAVGEARDLALEWAGAPQATILVFGDKVPAEIKSEVEAKVADVKKVAQGEDVEAIKASVQALGETIQKIGGAVYQGQAAPAGEAGPNPDEGPEVVEGEVKE